MRVDKLIEKTDNETLNSKADFSKKYYSAYKAKFIPLSFVIRAVKY